MKKILFALALFSVILVISFPTLAYEDNLNYREELFESIARKIHYNFIIEEIIYQNQLLERQFQEKLEIRQNIIAQRQQELRQQRLRDSLGVFPPTSEGQLYGIVTVSGTSIRSPVFWGDSYAILDRGVGTFNRGHGFSYPGSGARIMIMGHSNTDFRTLHGASIGGTVTIETNGGTFTYSIVDTQILRHDNRSAWDVQRDSEHIILYTCYPLNYDRSAGPTPYRLFVYAIKN